MITKVQASGVSAVSQYIADVLAVHVGLPEHVRELNQPTLSPAAGGDSIALRGHRIMVRPHCEVSQRVVAEQVRARVSSVSQYIADVLALHVGMPEHVRELYREVMPLLTPA